jgi:hypothetical protein
MKFKVDESPHFKPGDMPPPGYIERQEWAAVQMKAGLKQRTCGFCSLYCFPQELSGEEIRTRATTSRGLIVNRVVPICRKCKERRDGR